MPTVNTQPIEKQRFHQNGLEVFKIWRSIQGEGPYAGRRATFIRLAGCNLACPFCDTDYSSQRDTVPRSDIVRAVRMQSDRRDLVVITGGEPFRQDIGHLVWDLNDEKFLVQIETNGTLYREEFPFELAKIVCSPKTPKISEQLRPYIHSYKYILEAGKVNKEDGLPTCSLGMGVPVARPGPNRNVYVQPLDTGDPIENKKHIQAAVDSCIRFGYILSIQLHKLAGLE